MGEFAGTEKQFEIIQLVLAATDNSRTISLQELHKSLSWGPGVTKQSIMCSVDILEKHGFVQRVYGKDLDPVFRQGMRQYIQPTLKAYQMLRRALITE